MAALLDDLSGFTGRSYTGDDLTQAETVLDMVTTMASSYTRGRGFTAAGEALRDVRAAIVSAAARLLIDTSQIVESESMGPFRVSYAAHSSLWSTSELYVLNRYRVQAA